MRVDHHAPRRAFDRQDVAGSDAKPAEQVAPKKGLGKRVQLDQQQDVHESVNAAAKDWQTEISATKQDQKKKAEKWVNPTKGMSPEDAKAYWQAQRKAEKRAEAKAAKEAAKAQQTQGTGDAAPATTSGPSATKPTTSYDDVAVKLPERSQWTDHIPAAVRQHEHYATNKDNGAELAAGDPPGEGKIRWNDEHVYNTIEYGKKTGAVTDAINNDAYHVADGLTDSAGHPHKNDPSQPAKPIGKDAFAQALAERMDLDRVDGPQFLGALQYINSAKDAGQQRDRISASVLALQTMDKAGTPPLSRMQMEADLHFNSKVDWHVSHDYSVDGLKAERSKVLDATYSPGEHKVKLKKDRTLELKNDGDGKNLKTHVDKESTWDKVKDVAKKALPIILTVASFIPGVNLIAIPLNAAYSAYNAVKAAKNGDWLGAIAGAAGAITGGITAVAGKALSGVAQTVSKVASTVSKVAGGAKAILDGVKSDDWGAVLGGVASVAAGAAGAVSTAASGFAETMDKVSKWADRGATAYDAAMAAKDGDYLGAIGVGAGLAGDIAAERGNEKWQDRFEHAEKAAFVGRAVEDAVDNKDYFGAAQQLTEYVASTRTDGTKAKQRLETAAKVFQSVGVIDRSLDNKDYLGAAAAASKLAGDLSGKAGFERAGRLLDDASSLKQAVDSGNKLAMAKAAWDLGNTVKDVATEVRASRVARELDEAAAAAPPVADVAPGARPKREEPLPTTGAVLPEGPGVVEVGNDGQRRVGSYVVQPGDSLSKIAKQVYGEASKWPLLYDANEARIGADPNALRVGTTLTVPPAAATLPGWREEDIHATAAAYQPGGPLDIGFAETLDVVADDTRKAALLRESASVLEQAEWNLQQQPRWLGTQWDPAFAKEYDRVKSLRSRVSEARGAADGTLPSGKSKQEQIDYLESKTHELSRANQRLHAVINDYSDRNIRNLTLGLKVAEGAKLGADVVIGAFGGPALKGVYKGMTDAIERYTDTRSFQLAIDKGIRSGLSEASFAALTDKLKAARVSNAGQFVVDLYGKSANAALQSATDEMNEIAWRRNQGQLTDTQARARMRRVLSGALEAGRDRAMIELGAQGLKDVLGPGLQGASDAAHRLTENTVDELMERLVQERAAA